MITISGADVAGKIKQRLQEQNAREGMSPSLAVILVGDLPDSAVYVRLKEKAVQFIGGRFHLIKMKQNSEVNELLAVIGSLNNDDSINGIILQLPLPASLKPYQESLLQAIDPGKDVDGFHPENRGLLISGEPRFISCAALACLELAEGYLGSMQGKRAVLIGDSFDLIIPLALLLLHRQGRVEMLPEWMPGSLQACDLAVVEKGGPGIVNSLNPDGPRLLIDAGFYYTDKGLSGNVTTHALESEPGYLVPVPGGLGPILIAKLMENLNFAARRSQSCRNS